ncbi:MAG: hypothetical protein ACK5B9_11465 [Flavobacteriia bacterium]|jgi:hypothetical protein
MNTDLIQTGDLLHCEGNGIIAKGIKLFTKSKVTHTAVAIRIWGQLFIMDAQNEGVFPRPFNAWMRKYNYKFTVSRSPFHIHEENFAKRMMTMCGSPYDRDLFLKGYPKEIILKRNLEDSFEGNGKFICSEFAMWCHGVPQPFRYTPKEIVEYCDNHDWKTIDIM